MDEAPGRARSESRRRKGRRDAVLLGQGLGISRRQYARDFVESHAGTALVRVELPRAEKPESAPGADCGTWGHWRSRSVIGQSMAKDCPGDPIS